MKIVPRIKLKKILFRHAFIAILAGVLVYLFFLSRPELSSVHRIWRATGDAAFVLLFFTLAMGPLARVWRPSIKLMSWRRELGIWFALIAIIHTVLILNGWIQWDVMRFFGYEYIEQAGQYIRLEPGFGLANIIVIMAVFWAIVLLATSSDKAMNYLGFSSWKWLQYGAHTIFYLIVAHAAYFLFIHFTPSPYKGGLPPNWFQYPFLAMGLILLILQGSVFMKIVKQKKKGLNNEGNK